MDDGREQVLFCGNLSEEITEDILQELFLQAGPVDYVTIPKDKSGKNKNFAFIKYKHESSVLYAVALFKGIRLYDRDLQLDYRTGTGQVHNPYLDMLAQHAASTFPQEAMLHSPNYVPNKVQDGRFSQGISPSVEMSMPQGMNMKNCTPEMKPNFYENREQSWDRMNVNPNTPEQFIPVGPRYNYENWRPSQDKMSMNQSSPEQFTSPEIKHNFHRSGEEYQEKINMNQNNSEQSPEMRYFHRSRDRSRDRMDINQNSPKQFTSPGMRSNFRESGEWPRDRMDINQNSPKQFTSPGMRGNFRKSGEWPRDRMNINQNTPEQFTSPEMRSNFRKSGEWPRDRMDMNQNSPKQFTSPGMRSNFRESGEWPRNSDSSQQDNARRRVSYKQSNHRKSPHSQSH